MEKVQMCPNCGKALAIVHHGSQPYTVCHACGHQRPGLPGQWDAWIAEAAALLDVWLDPDKPFAARERARAEFLHTVSFDPARARAYSVVWREVVEPRLQNWT